MKPTHKLNGGDKATLCKVCRTIIDRDFTDFNEIWDNWV